MKVITAGSALPSTLPVAAWCFFEPQKFKYLFLKTRLFIRQSKYQTDVQSISSTTRNDVWFLDVLVKYGFCEHENILFMG